MLTLDPAHGVIRARGTTALELALLFGHIAAAGTLAAYAVAGIGSTAIAVFAGALLLLALWTTIGVVRRRWWTAWAALTLVSLKLTADLFLWSTGVARPLVLLSTALSLALLAVLFARPYRSSPTITGAQKVFYGCVLALALCIGVWGMVLPALADWVLPFPVPPLHARFLGAMYLSGATFMALSTGARQWAEVRVVTPMIAIWTGMLGIVSVLHLAAFDWSRKQVWVWFVAYLAFPIVAAWIAWQQRREHDQPAGVGLPASLRGYLLVQGLVVTGLALCLLLLTETMTAVWPWRITPVLAQIYSAPFLSYGLGSMVAARQRTWREIRIVVYATLLFVVGVLVASLLHMSLFSFAGPAAWLWFGGFAVCALALATAGLVERRTQGV